MPGDRDERREQVSLTLALCGFFGTLMLSRFPSPVSHAMIAGYNYFLITQGQEMAMKARHVHVGSLLNKISKNKEIYDRNAAVGGAIIGGLSVLPFGLGTLLACSASGVIGYVTPYVINWE